MPTLADQLHTLRRHVAEYTRNHPNPPHGADGRFYSGGTSGDKLPTEHLSQHGETPRPIASQCPQCGKITSSWHPQAGQRLPLASEEPRSHGGFCPECQRDWFVKNLLPGLMRKQGMSESDAMQHIDAIVAASQEQAVAQDKERAAQYQQWQKEQATPQRAIYAQFAERLAAIRMQVATVVRNATWTDAHGNTWEVIQGAGGKFEQVILLSHGPGQEHVAPPVGTKLGVHEASRMLREKMAKEGNPQKDEAKPGDKLHNVQQIDPNRLNPYIATHGGAVDVGALKEAFDDHQLGNALSVYSISTLRATAQELGLGKGGSKADLVTAIVAHVTRDETTGIPRYSADFRTPAGRTGMKSEFDGRGIHRKLTNEESAAAGRDHERMLQALNGHTGVVAPNGVPLGEWDDPQKLWDYTHGDTERVYRLISMYPQLWGMHEFIQQDPRFADVSARFKGFSRNATAQEMTEALDRHFNGNKASWGRNGRATQATTEHPDLEPYRRELARLHQQYAALLAARPDLAKQLEAHQKTAASGGKATGSKSKATLADILDDGLVPIKTGIQHQFDPSAPPDVMFLRELYGDDQLHAALSRYSFGRLKESVANLQAKGYAVKAGHNKEATIQNLMEHARNPQLVSTTKTAGGAKGSERALMDAVGRQITANPGSDLRFNSSNPLDDKSLSAFHRAYGSEQLKDVLFASSDLKALQAKADAMGIPSAKEMSRDALARAIADAVVAREGHIAGPPSHLDAILASSKTAGGAGKAKGGELIPIVAPGTLPTKFQDLNGPPDARFFHALYGDFQLKEALGRFTTPLLREAATAMQRDHPGTGPKNASRKADLIDYLVDETVKEQGHRGPQSQDELDAFLKTHKRTTIADLAARLHAITTTMLRAA